MGLPSPADPDRPTFQGSLELVLLLRTHDVGGFEVRRGCQRGNGRWPGVALRIPNGPARHCGREPGG